MYLLTDRDYYYPNKDVCYTNGALTAEFELDYSGTGWCDTLWFWAISGTAYHVYKGTAVAVVRFCPKDNVDDESWGRAAYAPRSPELQSMFRGVVLRGDPPEPFFDRLVEEFPQYEDLVQQLVEGK